MINKTEGLFIFESTDSKNSLRFQKILGDAQKGTFIRFAPKTSL